MGRDFRKGRSRTTLTDGPHRSVRRTPPSDDRHPITPAPSTTHPHGRVVRERPLRWGSRGCVRRGFAWDARHRVTPTPSKNHPHVRVVRERPLRTGTRGCVRRGFAWDARHRVTPTPSKNHPHVRVVRERPLRTGSTDTRDTGQRGMHGTRSRRYHGNPPLRRGRSRTTPTHGLHRMRETRGRAGCTAHDHTGVTGIHPLRRGRSRTTPTQGFHRMREVTRIALKAPSPARPADRRSLRRPRERRRT